MTIERAAALGIAVVSGLLVARLGPGAIRSWMIYSGTGKRRQMDASGQAPAAPPGVRDRMALLVESGYRHIGETRVDLPVGPRFAWIMAAANGDSYAIVAGGTGRVALTGLYSAWPDGMWLGTIHPMGNPTERAGLQVRVVTRTLDDAVETHRAGLERLRSVHGDPRAVRSMPDMLALDADYRERFGGSRLRPAAIRIAIPAVLAGCALALSLVLLAVSFR